MRFSRFSKAASSSSQPVARAASLNFCDSFFSVLVVVVFGMDYGFVAYIDEFGDPGIRQVSKFGSEGASEWLILGGILIRAEREAQVIQWARDIGSTLGLRQRLDLHYSDFKSARKAGLCGHLATLPLRGFVLVSNKKNMRG